MEDRFLRGRQIAYMIYEYSRVPGAHAAVLKYSDLFSIALHGDDTQDFDDRWDDFFLMSEKLPVTTSLAPRCQTQNDGTSCSKGKSPRGGRSSGRKLYESVM